eukprot:TRINITY_DN6351_c0_g1_i1.p1 TRINITY_DN6351_c0_g1~~TRINITY_DN6351_c0_g1_i1.p1  ORF type:complete len:1371 (+),score=513.48 TRINITY_DN6351_c0_g1_i1:503-4615(+)
MKGEPTLEEILEEEDNFSDDEFLAELTGDSSLLQSVSPNSQIVSPTLSPPLYSPTSSENNGKSFENSVKFLRKSGMKYEEDVKEIENIEKEIELHEALLADRVVFDGNLSEISGESLVSGIRNRSNSTSSVNSNSSQNVTSNQQNQRESIMDFRTLVLVSNYFDRNQKKNRLGIPTCLSVHHHRIIVGTSYGMVLVFNENEELVWKISNEGEMELGPVTTVDSTTFSQQQYIAAGYENGMILVWDSFTKKLLKKLKIESSPILHLKFLADKNRFVAVDEKGKMNSFTISKSLLRTSVDAQLILDGSNGQIVALSPFIQENLSFSWSLLAFASNQRAFLVSVFQSSVKVNVQIDRPGNKRRSGLSINPPSRPSSQIDSGLPCLSWCTTSLWKDMEESNNNNNRNNRDNLVYPTLAISWGKIIQLVQLTDTSKSQLSFERWKDVRLENRVNGISWIDGRVLVVLDDRDQLNVVNPINGSVIQTLDSKGMDIVYHTRFGSNLHCYGQSLRDYARGIYLIGIDKVYYLHLLDWEEQISKLVAASKYSEALLLTKRFYENHSKAIAVGLPREREKRRGIVAAKIISLLTSFIDYIHLTEDLQSSSKQRNQRWKWVGGECVEYSKVLSSDILFNEIAEKFKELGKEKEGFFLEVLEPYILNNQMSNLPPDIVQQFVEHYCSKHWLRRVEQVILHLDVSTLDFQQVEQLCRTHHLFRAFISIYNRGLLDYTTPLSFLLSFLFSPTQSEENQYDLEYAEEVTFEYITKCLTGNVGGDENMENLSTTSVVQSKVLAFLFQKDVHKEDRHPRIIKLLKLNARETLKCFSAYLDLRGGLIDHNYDQQKIVDIVISSMEEHKDMEKGSVYTFMLHYLAEGSIKIPMKLTNRAIFALLQVEDPITFNERERTLLSLVHKLYDEDPRGFQLNWDDIVLHAEQFEFYTLAEYLYSRKGNYTKMYQCRIRDPTYKHGIFDFLRELLTDEQHPEELAAKKNAVINVLDQLITLDSEESSKLIVDFFSAQSKSILKILEPHPHVQYLYLKSLLGKNAKEIVENAGIEIAPEMYSLYIYHMCKYSPDSVYNYLVTQDAYPLDASLRIVKQAGIVPAICYLLERTGDLNGALTLELKGIDGLFTSLSSSCKMKDKVEIADLEKKIVSVLTKATQLCKRNSQRVEDSEYAELWFRLLDAVVDPMSEYRKQISQEDLYVQKLQKYTKMILESMVGHVGFPAILSKIVKDHGSDELKDFRSIIEGMLDACTWEKTILGLTNRLICADVHHASQTYVKKRGTGIRSMSTHCFTCQQPFIPADIQIRHSYNLEDSSLNVIIFPCSHGFHGPCLPRDSNMVCPLCNKKKMSSTRNSTLLNNPSLMAVNTNTHRGNR